MSIKSKFILAVLLIAAVALLAGCAGQSREAKSGDNVSVDYALWVGDNTTIIETSNASWAKVAGIFNQTDADNGYYAPLNFSIGDGWYLPAFENATIGMKVGDVKNVTIQPADGYGEYDPAQIQPMNMSDLLDYMSNVLGVNNTPYVNETIQTFFGPVRVDSIQLNASDYNNSTVFIDYNHPLAGKVLHFKIQLLSID